MTVWNEIIWRLFPCATLCKRWQFQSIPGYCISHTNEAMPQNFLYKSRLGHYILFHSPRNSQSCRVCELMLLCVQKGNGLFFMTGITEPPDLRQKLNSYLFPWLRKNRTLQHTTWKQKDTYLMSIYCCTLKINDNRTTPWHWCQTLWRQRTGRECAYCPNHVNFLHPTNIHIKQKTMQCR